MLKKDAYFADFLYFLGAFCNDMTTMNNLNADIKLLVFDMGKVFVHFDWERTYEAFVKATKASMETVIAAIDAMYHPYERGELNTAQIVEHLNGKLGATLSHMDFAKLWTTTLDEDKEMTQLLQALRKKYPLYLLSNINETSYGYLQDNFNVAQHFDELVLSYEVGYMKPSHEIYHEVLKRSKLDPQHCLFIDDLEENIEAARTVGLHGIQFTGINNLHKELKQYGVEV